MPPVFADHLLANLATFALGGGVAVAWMRTGMVRRGVALLIVLLLAADVALVQRVVYGDRGTAFVAALATMQVSTWAAIAWLLFAVGRRRWSADSRRRQELFTAGLQHYLRSELPAARKVFERLRRADPWDTAALVALANVTWRQGQAGRARSLYRAARRLDRRRGYADFIDIQLQRMTDREQLDAS